MTFPFSAWSTWSGNTVPNDPEDRRRIYRTKFYDSGGKGSKTVRAFEEFFRGRGNAWATAAEVAEATGAKLKTTKIYLCSFRNLFESKSPLRTEFGPPATYSYRLRGES